ncbi:MAG: hypothetical protein J6V26_01360 [Alistipes sp.]|nr:hypothetical protein [Alistipes sp.]
MKRLIKFFALVALLSAFSACSIETDVSNTTANDIPEKSYTIIYYNCCSGLDKAIEPFFFCVGQLNIPKRINVVGQIKWTPGYRSNSAELSDGSGGVQRFVFNHDKNKVDIADFDDVEYRVDDPQNLADFITWARKAAPADEYIMVFCGHGNAYHPAFDDVTRGILRDDHFTSYLGIGDIREAFEIAGVADNKFALTMMICCVMNTLEYSTELIPYTDYYLASGHVTVATSKELFYLIDGLIKHGNDGEEAVVNAVQYAVDADYEGLGSSNVQDTTLVHSLRIKKLNEKIKSFVNRLCALYDEESVMGESGMKEKYGFSTKDIDEALASSYYYLQPFLDASGSVSSWYQTSCNYDIVDIVTRVAAVANDDALSLYAREVEKTALDAIVYQYKHKLDRAVYHAVTLVNKYEWIDLNFEGANYSDLAFDQATNWSNLLKMNSARFDHDMK